MAARNEVGISLTARDLASREIEKVGGALHTVGDEAEETGSKTGLLGRIAGGVFQGVFLGAGMYAFGQVANGFGFVKDSAIGFNNQMQQASIAFTTMLGSGTKAQAFLTQLKDFAAKTPFEFPDLLTASQRLLAMGFAAKDVIPDLTAIGDAAAGLGASPETIDRVTLALGQMHAKGKVSAEEMMQLTEAGIPAWDFLSKAIGKSTSETMKLSEEGLIPADKAIKAITDGMETRFGGMMDKQAHTFSGSMSTIHDVVQSVMATAFSPFFDIISNIADKMAQWLSSGDAQAWAERTAGAIKTVLGALGSLADTVLALPRYFQAVLDDGDYMNDWLTHLPEPIRGVVEAFGALITGAGSVQDVFDAIGDTFAKVDVSGLIDKFFDLREKVGQAVLSFAQTAIPKLTEAVNIIAANLPGILSKVLPVILDAARRWAEGTMEFVGHLVDILHDNFPTILQAISNLFQSIFDWIINTGVPMAAAALADFASKFLDWVFEVAPKVLDMIDQLIAAIINFVITNGPVLAGKLVEWGLAFIGWIVTVALPKLAENLPTILRALLLFLGGAAPKLVGKIGEMGSAMIARLIVWLGKMPGETAAWLAKVLFRVLVWAEKMVLQAKEAASNFVAKVIGFLKDLPFKVAGILLDIIGHVLKFGGDLARTGVNAAAGFVLKVAQFIGLLPGRIAGFFAQIISAVLKFGGDLIHGAATAAGNFVNGFIGGLASLPGKLFNAIRNAFANLHIDIGPFHISASGVTIDLPHIDLPHFATGAWKLPADMMAVVHKGEMIIPADIAARLRGEQGAPAPGVSTPSIATSAAAAPMAVVQISNYYGPSSVRSADDIRRISEEQAENIRLMGFTPVVRTNGSLG